MAARVASAEVAHQPVKASTSRALPTQVAEVRQAACQEAAAEAKSAEVAEEVAVVAVPLGLVTKA